MVGGGVNGTGNIKMVGNVIKSTSNYYFLNINVDPTKVYLFGVVTSMFIYGIYKCNDELKKQNDNKKCNMIKVTNKTIIGFIQGLLPGLFWPIIMPTIIYRSISNKFL